MHDGDDFEGYVESLPTMLTLLSDAVEVDRGATTPSIQDLRAALHAALAAAERLRLEHRRKSRQKQAKSNGGRAHLQLVSLDHLIEAP